jgi:diaminohydroxyphosphoribosylaminopyrimidine deaminase/5-amino-6-(5-phosphoribosylamino)uracil reductase
MPIHHQAAKWPSPAAQWIADTDSTWAAILAVSDLARRGNLPDKAMTYAVDSPGTLRQVPTQDPKGLIAWNPGQGWQPAQELPAGVRDLLELYLPVCSTSAKDTLTVGHLGQSLDGCIATKSGDSCYVTGRQNILHLHRMRALCDAVVVGAETVARDDPRLTTRLVPGESPVRVVLDPRRRLPAGHRIFMDGEAPTLLICAVGQGLMSATRVGEAAVAAVATHGGNGHLDLAAVLQELHSRGLRRVFVEGGGVTVSAFLLAGLLDRLQVAIAPVIIGDGRRGLQLPATATMGDCRRPHCRIFQMGGDILFDCIPEKGEGREGGE